MFKRIRRRWSVDLRSLSARAKRLENNVKNFNLLITDLESMPDLLRGSVRLYAVGGDKDDPEARFVGNIPSNFPLVASLQAAYDANTITLGDDVLGLALAGTAVRHLTFREYLERDPEMIDRVLAQARADNVIETQDVKKFNKKATAIMERYYMSRIVPNLPPAPNMPDNMRVRAVVVSVMMKDGLSFVIHNNTASGKDLDIEAMTDEVIAGNLDFNVLYQYLNGVRPELVEDPFERVTEFKLLRSAFDGDS